MKKILLVEDELFLLELYERTLRRAGYQVATAADGEVALDLAKDQPGLILLDVMLPKVHGLEVLRRLKGDETTKAIPVILLTNLGQESILEEARRLGAAACLMKVKLTPNELLDFVREFLEGRRPQDSPAASQIES